jgi:N-methylhydantoinase A
MIVSIDTGGTFTDLAAFDVASGRITYTKSLTTYGNLADGVSDCMAKAGVDLSRTSLFKHGTTLVINALIQRNGARTALVTTRGFRDILELGRGNRPEPFDLFFRRNPSLVPRELRFEIDERTSAAGESVVAPSRREVEDLARALRADGVEAVAVAFLNAYVEPAHEQQVAAWLRELLPDVYVTSSAELSQEWYEFERTATVAANAYVGPQVAGYASRLDHALAQRSFGGRFFMMGSNGGVLGLQQALAKPIILVESGPVGGCIGTSAFAEASNLDNVIAFDMGGTTAKCALVQRGRFDVKPVYYIGGYERGFPIRGSVIDIVEVGAGGGSIAWLDGQRRLHVGPRSAGSVPGPVAYRRGGAEPTVTDANAVLGRLDPKGFLGGEMDLDVDAAHRATREKVAAPLGYDSPDGVRRMADGILTLACVTMASAIKRITVERGRDPRDYVLFAYGGGGPLHATQVARELHIPLVVIPPEPGNFSAIGMLLADVRRDEARTFLRPLGAEAVAEMASVFAEMEAAMRTVLRTDTDGGRAAFEHHAEVRYRGQVHSVLTPVDGIDDPKALRERFEALYHARYGHAQSKNPVEIVSLRLAGHGMIDRPDLAVLAPNRDAATSPAPRVREVYFAEAGGPTPTRVFKRRDLPHGFAAEGPVLIEEYGSTTVVGPADRFEIGRLGEIRIQVGKAH